jgi:hypothetical protein
VIGVYEPLVLVRASGPFETSLAAMPELYSTDQIWYHRACYAQDNFDELQQSAS